jgi:hypothetical protein
VLPPEVAPAHTHHAYTDTELGKWMAKLAWVCQGEASALEGWDKELDAVDDKEACYVLEDVDATLAAAEERQMELGLPAFQGRRGERRKAHRAVCLHSVKS